MRLPGWFLFLLLAVLGLAMWEMPGVVWGLAFVVLLGKVWQFRRYGRVRGVRS